jgi:hypothetical protein
MYEISIIFEAQTLSFGGSFCKVLYDQNEGGQQINQAIPTVT